MSGQCQACQNEDAGRFGFCERCREVLLAQCAVLNDSSFADKCDWIERCPQCEQYTLATLIYNGTCDECA